jgi:phage-related protein
VIDAVVGVFTKYMDLLIPLGGVILGVVLAVKAYELASNLASVAQGIWNGVQAAFNFIMAANPILLVVLAIAALVAAVVLAYKKVGWFRDFVDASWDAVVAAFDMLKDAAVKVFDWIKNNWPLLLAVLTGPFGIAVKLIVDNWDTIKAGATDVWNWVKAKFDALASFFGGLGSTIGSAITVIVDWIKKPIQAATDVYDAIAEKFGAVVSFLSGLVHKISGPVGDIVNAIKNPINTVIRAWNNLEFRIPSIDTHLPGIGTVGGQTVGFPNIPTLQTGGRVMRTGFAVVHEGEQFSGVGKSFGGSTVINVNVTTTGLGPDSPQIQRAVVNAIRGHVARNGPLDFAVRTGS